MIIKDSSVSISILLEDDVYHGLLLQDADKILSEYKNKYTNLKPRESKKIENAQMYFDDDENKNKFNIEVYKTSQGEDKWILFMKDDIQGYALYENPSTNEYELAWYHSKLDKPLTKEEEKSLINCYIPKNY